MSKVRKFSRIVSMILVAVMSTMMLFTTVAFAAENIPDATSNFYVNDFANVIDDVAEWEMQQRAVALADSSDGVQVVVTTVQTIGDADPVQYTVDMYNKYEIGKNSMGVLVMLSVETRDIQIRTGDNMTKYLSATIINDILEEDGYPYLGNNEFSRGLDEIQNSIVKHIEKKIKKDTVASEVAVIPENETAEDVKKDGLFGTIFASLAVIGGGIGSCFGINKYSKKKKKEREIARISTIENSEIFKLKSEKIRKIEEKISEVCRFVSYQINIFSKECDDHIRALGNHISDIDGMLNFNQLEKDKYEDRLERALEVHPELNERVDTALSDVIISQSDEEVLKARDCKYTTDDSGVAEEFEDKKNGTMVEISEAINKAVKEIDAISDFSIEQLLNFDYSASKSWKEKVAAKASAKEGEMILNSDIIQRKNQRISELMATLSNTIPTEASAKLVDILRRFENNRQVKMREFKESLSILANSEREMIMICARKAKAVELYPNLEAEIDEVFRQEKIVADKQVAERVEKNISAIFSMGSISRAYLGAYEHALNDYNRLTFDQKQYIESDLISNLRKGLKEANRLQDEWEEEQRIKRNKEKAATVDGALQRALLTSTSRHNLHVFKDACRAYDGLTSEQRRYVTADYDRVSSLRREAQREQYRYEEEERRRREREEAERRRREREEAERRRRREEEERRRREEEDRRRRQQQSMYRSSSSSFGSGSSRSHSGFGGRSSGRGGGGKF